VNIATPQTLSVKRGQTATQTLDISLRSGFHVNSDKPKDEFLIPIKLTWMSGPLAAKQITYPKPEDVKVGEDTLSVFTGKFTIARRTEWQDVRYFFGAAAKQGLLRGRTVSGKAGL